MVFEGFLLLLVYDLDDASNGVQLAVSTVNAHDVIFHGYLRQYFYEGTREFYMRQAYRRLTGELI
jgi:hypothetical protein